MHNCYFNEKFYFYRTKHINYFTFFFFLYQLEVIPGLQKPKLMYHDYTEKNVYEHCPQRNLHSIMQVPDNF